MTLEYVVRRNLEIRKRQIERRKMAKRKLIVEMVILICLCSALVIGVDHAQNKPNIVTVEGNTILMPVGYEARYIQVLAEKGDSIEKTARELRHKFQLEKIVDLHTYQLCFLALNANVKNVKTDYKSGNQYMWVYWIPLE